MSESGSTTFEVFAMGGKMINSRVVGGAAGANPIRKDQAGNRIIAWWGEDNLYPQQLNEWIEKHPILSSKLPGFAQLIASGGVRYGDETADGFQPGFDPKIEAFNKQINLQRFLIDFPVEVVKFNNGFAELILSKDRKKIVNLVAHDSTYCRLSRLDAPEMKNKPQRCYLSANWDLGDSEDSEYTENREVIDPYGDRILQVREGSEFGYIYPVIGPSSGRSYYGEPAWTAAIKSGWLKYSLAIPEAKNAKIDNAMMVMIHIEVPDSYWGAAFPDWEEKKDLQKNRMKEKQSEWTKIFTSKENWGKTVMTSYKQFNDGQTGHHILFKVLENPFKNSELIEDSFEANSQVYQALGIDATLFGTIPGKQMGAGSGSDKEWAWILAMLNSKPLQDLILEPLQFIYDYNGFGKKLVFNNYLLAMQYMLKARGDKKDPNPSDPSK